MMVGGSALFIFCLFMVSLSSPDQYYQACTFYLARSRPLMPSLSPQLFLAQGLGLGIAQGFLYLPSLGAVGRHFNRRRTLALGIVASGAAVGGIIHPIMLNQLFNGHVGFHNGVRISAGLNGAMLVAANLLSTHKEHKALPREVRMAKKWYQFFLEPSYSTAVAG